MADPPSAVLGDAVVGDALSMPLPMGDDACVSRAAGDTSEQFVDLFMTITVGMAALVVLFRVFFTVFPLAAAPATPATTTASTNTAGTTPSATTRFGGSSGGSSSNNGGAAGGAPLKRASSVKQRLESEIRAVLPRRSTYYAMPFFADTVANKQEFLESLIELGDDMLDGWLLVKKGIRRGKNWKKRYVVLDANGRIKYYPNADAARRNVNIKGSLAVHAVKPADPFEFGANTLEVRGTLGGTYFFRAEDEMAARKWLCVITKRAIQSRVPGRIDSVLSSAVAPLSAGLTGDDTNGPPSAHKRIADVPENGVLSNGTDHDSAGSSGPSSAPSVRLKSHVFEAFVEDMSYSKDSSLRQFYVVIKFKSELHDHSATPVGQTVPKPCDKAGGVVTWQEKLSWHFQDHHCADCLECRALGSTTGAFCGLPDIMVLHVYEIHLRYLTTKIGEVSISLREMFGFVGMKEAQIHCSWPVTSTTDSILGNLSLKLQYNVDSAGGGATVPFLVTSEAERELLGEYDIHPGVKTPAEFFELFYADGMDVKWGEFFKERGDTEVEIGTWSESKEYGGQVRVSSARSLTNASIGPSTTMTTNTEHVFFADLSTADPDKFVIESKVFLHDIPYGDCFTVEKVVVVEKPPPGGNMVAKVYLGIPFSKGCMFKSKIISATRESVALSAKQCYEALNHTIDGSSAVSITPFLVSTEEERQVVGEYAIHPSVKDAMHFFDLFYADNTEARWEGVYKESGDANHVFGEWADSAEYGGQVRETKYRAKSNSSLGPAYTMATQSQHVSFNSKRENVDVNHLVLEQKLTLHEIPYGDCFHVETVYVLDREPDGKLLARVYIAIPFSKSTMFKSKIFSATKDGVVKSTKLVFDKLREALDEDIPNASNSPVRRSLPGGGGRTSSSASDNSSTSARAATAPALISQPAAPATPPAPAAPQKPAFRRPTLMRYNSTLDGSVALEEIFENQRVSMFGKWAPNHLLPTDRARFTSREGDTQLSFEQVNLPPHWIWTTPWRIDKSYTECDDEGWSYASDFPRFKFHLARGRSSKQRIGASVRRRRWIRMMAYVPPDASVTSDTAHGNGAPSN